MATSRANRGTRGENAACRFLESLGYTILHRNLRLSHCEVDIICRDGDCLVFVEVKTSHTDGFGHPATWIGEKKQDNLRRAAAMYMDKYHISGTDIRFDAVTITGGKLEHYPNAF